MRSPYCKLTTQSLFTVCTAQQGTTPVPDGGNGCGKENDGGGKSEHRRGWDWEEERGVEKSWEWGSKRGEKGVGVKVGKGRRGGGSEVGVGVVVRGGNEG